MAQVVKMDDKKKKKAAAQPKATAPPVAPVDSGSVPPSQSGARAALHEGADELRTKLRSDISRWSRVRRFASLKPVIQCFHCDDGAIGCTHCNGTGRGKRSAEGEPQPCITCDGTGSITCVVCAGAGEVENVHRKKIKWILIAGGVFWVILILQLAGVDIMPHWKAKIVERGEHGKSVATPSGGVSMRTRKLPGASAPRGHVPGVQPGVTQGGGPVQGATYGAPASAPVPATPQSGLQPMQGGGTDGSQPQHGGGVSLPR